MKTVNKDNKKIFLLCKCKKNPIGIDKNSIMLSIQTENISSVKNVKFNVYKSKNNLVVGEAVDSFDGKEEYHVEFPLPQAVCGEMYYWNVQIFTEKEEIVSEYATFEIGLDEKYSDHWIQNEQYNGHVSNFTKFFTIKNNALKVRLYICGLGFYNSYINGKATDENYFKPLLTDYDNRTGLKNSCYIENEFRNSKKSVAYDAYDIKDKIVMGENKLSVLLGTGWYCNVDKDNIDPSFTFGIPKLFFLIKIYYKDYIEVIKSDTTCLVQNTNIISQLYRGDYVDFSAEENERHCAVKAQRPSGDFITTTAQNDKIFMKKKPVLVLKNGGRTIYDFGENHSGALTFFVRGEKGAKLRVRHYETLRDGLPNPDSALWIGYDADFNEVDRIEQDNFYILSGGKDEIKPYFHWNCFRYVEFECQTEFEISELASLFICSDIKVDGNFHCSNRFFNNFYSAYIRTQLSNMHCGVPSDCPHREKLPYTGDGQLSAESAFYSLEAEGFYRKWLDDIIDSQSASGWIPYSAPYIGGAGGAWWSNALIILPFIIYNFSGDKTIFRKVCKAAIKLVDFYDSMHDGDYIILKSEIKLIIGEWLTPVFTEIDLGFINTLGFYYAVTKTIEICNFCSENSDRLIILKEKIKKSILSKYYDTESHEFCNGIQGASVLPIALEILDSQEEKKAWAKVVLHYRNSKRFDTGIILTPILLNELVKRKQYKLAYQLMISNDKPSFKYMLNGETTLCEHWNKMWPPYVSGEQGKIFDQGGDVSHCHPIFGSVAVWFHKSVAGLDLSELSERIIKISPKYLGEVKSAEAYKKTIYGTTSCKYQRGKKLTMEIVIPKGCRGELDIKYKKTCMLTYENNTSCKMIPEKGRIRAKLLGGIYTIKEVE